MSKASGSDVSLDKLAKQAWRPKNEKVVHAENEYHQPGLNDHLAVITSGLHSEKVLKKVKGVTPGAVLRAALPVSVWLPAYFKKNVGKKLVSDFVCGMTITAIVVPQGMAYGMLASLPPVHGLYTSMLPTIGYAIFGTSMHLSVGPFALISMLTTEGILVVVEDPEKNPELAIATAAILSLLCGVMLIVLGLLRLGFLASFLSDPVLSGFCTAAALIIPTSQMKHALQISFDRGTWISTIVQIVTGLPDANWYAFLIFLCSMMIIIGIQKINGSGKVRILKKFPLPGELLLVVIMTAVSYLADFSSEDGLGISVLGKIPEGLPAFTVPDFSKLIDQFGVLAAPATVVSLMTYITAMSVSKTFARKFNYEVDNNQELIALGAANLLGSISGCYPAAASLSRTAVVGSSGAASPLHNVWTVLLLAFVLLFCGPLLENLPKPSLAAIVVMAFKSLLLNGIKEMKMAFRVSLPDFGMWMIAFLSTLALGVTPGIMCAVMADILYLFKETTRPSHSSLGRLDLSDKVYRKRKKYDDANAVHGLLIFRFDGPLHFANRDAFTSHLWAEFHDHNSEISEILDKRKSTEALASDSTVENLAEKIHTVILDCSPTTHIDMTAVRVLEKLRVELYNHECRLLLAHCRYDVHRKLHQMGLFKAFSGGSFFDIVCFHNLHDAVLYAEGKLGQGSEPQSGIAQLNRFKLQRSSTTGLLDQNGIQTGASNNDTFEDIIMVTKNMDQLEATPDIAGEGAIQEEGALPESKIQIEGEDSRLQSGALKSANASEEALRRLADANTKLALATEQVAKAEVVHSAETKEHNDLTAESEQQSSSEDEYKKAHQRWLSASQESQKAADQRIQSLERELNDLRQLLVESESNAKLRNCADSLD